jgi:hypothetical protein
MPPTEAAMPVAHDGLQEDYVHQVVDHAKR